MAEPVIDIKELRAGWGQAAAAQPEIAPPPPEPPLLLDPQAPLNNAREFALRWCSRDGARKVWCWGDQFWRWNGQYYAPFDKEQLRGQVYSFLDGAVRHVRDKTPFKQKRSHVEELLDALRSCLALDPDCVPPMWLDGEEPEPAGDWIVFRNRIVNARTSEERPLTHQLWSHSGLGFDWDHEAECETWWRFLDDLFGDDGESVTFLMEFMGYCMTDDVRFDKAAMLIGPKRSGKSTIVNLIGKLTGEGAYAGLSLNDWLSSPKATQVLIGKRVLAFSDVRLKPEKWYGQSYDAGGMDHRSRELMLKITGRDKVRSRGCMPRRGTECCRARSY